MKILMLPIVLLAYLQFAFADDYCFGKDRDRSQTRHFSSKTAYQIVKGTNMDKQYLVPGCEPTKIWLYHRHGTRLPSINFINSVSRLEELRDEIIKNYRVRHTKPDMNALCLEDLVALQMWHWNSSIQPEHANYLTSQGYEDLRGTAKLYQRYFPDILPRYYNPNTYLFRHSNTQRTEESLKAFAEGLFGSDNGVEAAPVPVKDLLLRPYDYCEAWKENDDGNSKVESQKFRQTLLWQNMVQDISARLGFLYNLTDVDIDKIFDICRYEQAWHVDRTSVWCAAFLPEHIALLEYDEDLKYYYKAGYGYPENQHLSCAAVKDMLQHLSNTTSQPRVVVNFAHSSGLQTLLTALGINKDEFPLKADNYNEQTARRWQTSQNDPFAANFLAVKYQCASDAVSPEKVIFFLNQNAVYLDWCVVGLCDWSEVTKRYSSFNDVQCDSVYCSGALRAVSSTLALIFTAIVYFIL